MRRTRQPVTTAAAALVMLVLLAVPAAAQYPPTAGEVTDATIIVENPDATIEIEGSDWSGNTTVEITYTDADGNAQTLGQATTDADGNFVTAVTLPDGVDPGDVTFTVVDGASGNTDSFTLASTETGGDGAAGTDDESSALAATGAPTGAMAVALGLLTAGALAVGGARRWGRRFDTAV